MDIEVVDADFPGYGVWSPIVRQLEALGEGRALKITPRLTQSQVSSLRSAAKWRKWSVHCRHSPEASYVWLGLPREGFEKYSKKKLVDGVDESA